MTEPDATRAEHASLSHEDEPVTEEHRAILKAQRAAALQNPPGNHGDIAYQMLLLQQRLEAYERLHREEMAELRQELDRLRKTFLEETSLQMRAIKLGREPHHPQE
ncbi:hypothetical protein KSF_037550 [Reticulibacter mediterranei]|uniref:Uncharacterized protein n=1 Tax=Reticulibacter mediterranei TaxID=2778369 RepID=A0A8J3N439_9CHLR|nr:hypothetical protein [Reticulibacter mediterranei]GHO93707.1 hypothetical protein KSF_037550 [Reticulibacter mediterranei]